MALFTAAGHPNAMIIWGLVKFGNFSFIKVKYALFSCPVIRLLCIYPKEMKTCPYKDLLMVALFKSKGKKIQMNTNTTRESWYRHATEHYSQQEGQTARINNTEHY